MAPSIISSPGAMDAGNSFTTMATYERFARGLAEEVDRNGWIVIAYCWMPTHIHALIKTLPQ